MASNLLCFYTANNFPIYGVKLFPKWSIKLVSAKDSADEFQRKEFFRVKFFSKRPINLIAAYSLRVP